MIISASRRTDIPALYSRWLFHRLEAGFCEVANPFNPRQIARVSLLPEDVDAIFFWTKNPAPMLDRIPDLDARGFRSLYLVTLVGYPRALEPYCPAPRRALNTLRRLSDLVGPARVTWRYDPIIIGDYASADWHRRNFAWLAGELAGRVAKVTVSIVDLYRKTRRRFGDLEGDGQKVHAGADHDPTTLELLRDLAAIAAGHALALESCAEPVWPDLVEVPHGRCIDPGQIERAYGLTLNGKKDSGQREACGCVKSQDIGAVDSCLLGCRYCYAVSRHDRAVENFKRHRPEAARLAAHLFSPRGTERAGGPARSGAKGRAAPDATWAEGEGRKPDQ